MFNKRNEESSSITVIESKYFEDGPVTILTKSFVSTRYNGINGYFRFVCLI